MRFTFLFLSFIAALYSFNAAASGWLSGGSELLKDARNPWFINNTKVVKYCISVDEKNFGIQRPALKEHIRVGFEFWKRELSTAITQSFSTFGHLRFADQTFVETTCADDVDISFQFGVLTANQSEFLKSPTEFAAVTVRTEYSRINLRGKGFIYFSPIGGPLAYNAEGVIPDAWSKDSGRFLQLAIIHELGHVFGIPHMGSRLGGIMSEDFIESSISLANQTAMEEVPEPTFMSLPKKSTVLCSENPHLKTWTDFFELADDEHCIEFRFEHDSNSELFRNSKLSVYARKNKASSPRLSAVVSLKMSRFNPIFSNLIWLTDEQRVIPKDEMVKIGMNGILGLNLIGLTKQGNFTTTRSNSKRHLSARFEQGKSYFFIDGVSPEGEIITIL